MNNFIKNRTVRMLGVLSLLLMIIIISVSYLYYIDMRNINSHTEDNLKNVKEARWVFVQAVLEENLTKAKMQADQVRDKIEYDLLTEYKDNLDRLKQDLDSTIDNKAMQILDKNIEGKYLNVKNDSNDMFIATYKGIISDKSLDCSLGKINRTWDEEIPMHWNQKLSGSNINMILTQSIALKFWEFKQHDGDNELQHEVLYYPSLQGLKRVYDNEGITGLSNYEFLVASYIKNDKDIFNVSDVGIRGIKNNNYKLIVVQGFNLIDDLNTNHIEKLSYFSNLEKTIIRESIMEKNEKLTHLFLELALLIVSFIGVTVTTKYIMIKWGGDDV